MLEAHPPLAGWAVGETAFVGLGAKSPIEDSIANLHNQLIAAYLTASAQEVLSPYSSIHPPPNLRINIATLNLSLLSLNQGTKVKSTKLAKSLKEESLNCQATVANVPLVDWRPAKHQLQDKVVLAPCHRYCKPACSGGYHNQILATQVNI
ncbi:hypothetical protein BDZ91DRAFT_479169 [Kalaharituber pfeilii]|nr:hypothetical protein BDZ91DRAFT_479169 [Kalaharituber pfeilii]